MSRPEHYQYMRIPARLLRDELLDHRDALHELMARDINDQEPVPREWQAEGTYDHEVEVGVEWKVEDYTHNGARGGYRLSEEGEPWTWLDENRSGYRLSQSAQAAVRHDYWAHDAGDISGTIARTMVEAYCQTIPEWPAGLDQAALFALYTDEIIEMGPRGWAEAMGLEGWDWTEPRPIP